MNIKWDSLYKSETKEKRNFVSSYISVEKSNFMNLCNFLSGVRTLR